MIMSRRSERREDAYLTAIGSVAGAAPVGVWALRRAHEEFLASFTSKFAKINSDVYCFVLFYRVFLGRRMAWLY